MLKCLRTFILLDLSLLSEEEVTNTDGMTNDVKTISDTKELEVDSENFSELEELVLRVKHLIISLLKE